MLHDSKREYRRMYPVFIEAECGLSVKILLRFIRVGWDK